jgi:hypothetical protein
MTPDEAKELYASPTFTMIQNEAITFHIKGAQWPKTGLDFSSFWVNDMLHAQDLLAVTYFCLKHGKYDGSHDEELDPYLDRLVANWNDIIEGGALDRFAFNQNYCVYKFKPVRDTPYATGWYEGDISLRLFVPGALPAYDLYRDDIGAAQREKIDTWLDGLYGYFARKDKPPFENPLYYLSHVHNRAASCYSQSMLIGLLLQDEDMVNHVFEDTAGYPVPTGGRAHPMGLMNQFEELWNFNPHNCYEGTGPTGCYDLPANIWNPPLPGLPRDLVVSDATHGIDHIHHFFTCWASLTHASRTGGPAHWDIRNQANQEMLDEMKQM